MCVVTRMNQTAALRIEMKNHQEVSIASTSCLAFFCYYKIICVGNSCVNSMLVFCLLQ